MSQKFDELINRKNTGSEKWDHCDKIFGGENLLPLWVADMDFRVPREVINALTEKSEHGIFGYTSYMDSAYESVINWFSRRHRWSINKEWILYSPGVVPALNLIVQTFTDPSDSVIIQRPVYHPFMKIVENNERRILNNPLCKNSAGNYEMDFPGLEIQASKSSARMMILCSPHNPVGRVWTENELKEVIRICRDNNIILVSDDIHCDLVFDSYKHIPLQTIAGDFSNNIITCTAPSKTFNLAGVQISNIIIPDEIKRIKFRSALLKAGMFETNSFAPVAMEAAYNYGNEWLDDLIKYIYKNYQFLKEFVHNELRAAEVAQLQGTYLAWVDFRRYGLSVKELDELFIKKAHVAPSPGYLFGPEGAGFMRFNLACPGSILEEGMKRIAATFGNLHL